MTVAVTDTSGTDLAPEPLDLLSSLVPTFQAAGISRLSEVTQLDGLGIPVFQAVRPFSRTLTVSQGKGLTREAAATAAGMEAIELAAAEQIPAASRTIARDFPLTYDPQDLYRESGAPLRPNVIEAWVRAEDVAQGCDTVVPHDAVHLDFVVSPTWRPLGFQRTSTGMGAHHGHEQAAVHGLLEVVERDALAAVQRGEKTMVPCALASGLPEGSVLSRLVHITWRARLQVCAWVGSSAIGLPTARARLRSPDLGRDFSGTACRPRAVDAVVDAILEAVQSRLTAIVGARDDIPRDIYGDGSRIVFQADESNSKHALPFDEFEAWDLQTPSDLPTLVLACAERFRRVLPPHRILRAEDRRLGGVYLRVHRRRRAVGDHGRGFRADDTVRLVACQVTISIVSSPPHWTNRRPAGRLLARALDDVALCTADPMCAEHDPSSDNSTHGAALPRLPVRLRDELRAR